MLPLPVRSPVLTSKACPFAVAQALGGGGLEDDDDDIRVTKMHLRAIGPQLGPHRKPGSVRLQDAMYRQVLLVSPKVNTSPRAECCSGSVQPRKTPFP